MEQYIHTVTGTCAHTHAHVEFPDGSEGSMDGKQDNNHLAQTEEESRGRQGWKAEPSLRHVTFHTGSEAEKGLMARGDQRDGSLNKS